MSDLLDITKSVVPFWKVIALSLVWVGVGVAYWKADKDFSKMVHHTMSERSAPYQDVVLTEIMTATNRTQYLMLGLIGVMTISLLPP